MLNLNHSSPVVDADVVILAGDIYVRNKGIAWARGKFEHIPVIYVLGNHEFYGEALPKHIDKLKEQTQGTNIHILENESLHIQGIQFLGCTLWTNFNLFGNPGIARHTAALEMTDYKKIRLSPSFRKLRPADTAGLSQIVELVKRGNDKICRKSGLLLLIMLPVRYPYRIPS